MEKKDLKEKLKCLKEHKPIVVNYGKYEDGRDILENSYWNEEKGKYASETGWWSMDLLIEIAKGEVPETSLEILENE